MTGCINLFKLAVIYIVQASMLLCPPTAYHMTESLTWFSFLIFSSVPVPQAIADPEPADLDRVQCGFVPVILSAAL